MKNTIIIIVYIDFIHEIKEIVHVIIIKNGVQQYFYCTNSCKIRNVKAHDMKKICVRHLTA